MDIIKKINEYITLSEDKAKQQEPKIIQLMKESFIEEQHYALAEDLILKYLLSFLRVMNKPIKSRAWTFLVDGNSLNKTFIQFIKDQGWWNHYVAQLLCILDKDHINWGEKEDSYYHDWIEDEMFVNLDYKNSWEDTGIYYPDIFFEWEHLKQTKEWKETDISNIKSRDNLSGIALMKYLDSTLTHKQIMNRINEEKIISSHKSYYAIYLDENNKPIIRSNCNPLLLRAKLYDEDFILYLFKEDEIQEEDDNIIEEKTSPLKYSSLTPVDLNIVFISKEYNIKKLVVQTQEGYTVHLLYDELPAQLLKDVYMFELINSTKDIENTLRKKVLDQYRIYAEFDKQTNTIQQTPFLTETKNIVFDKLLYICPEWIRYMKRNADYSLVDNIHAQLVFKIDQVCYLKSSKQIQLKTTLTKQEVEALEKALGNSFAPFFGDLELEDNILTITLKDVLSALAYNAISKADGSNNIFDLIKDNNEIKLIFHYVNNIDPKLGSINFINYCYVPKINK